MNWIKLKFFMVYPYLKLFISNGQLSGLIFKILRILKKLWPIIGHFGRHDLISVRILPNLELIRAISEINVWYIFQSDTYKNNE